MDNFNALSKSAILTKLALDGYFIDLLTLNSFIEKWHIEAIYENEYGIEFFDNNSYAAILSNLKDKYNQTKESLEGNLKETVLEDKQFQQEAPQQTVLDEITIEETLPEAASVDNFDVVADEIPLQQEPQPEPEAETYTEPVQEEPVSEEPVKETYPTSPIEEHIQENIQIGETETYEDIPEEPTIMPRAMKKLTPGPVAPNSTLHIDYDYIPEPDAIIRESEETFEEPAEAAPEQPQAQGEDDSKNDEMDLMQLAQSFAKSLTTPDEPAEPAGLDQIFEESYTESFENLQNFAENEALLEEALHEEARAKEANEPAPETPAQYTEPEQTAEPEQKSEEAAETKAETSSPEDIRQIIREEIAKQTENMLPTIQGGENIRDVVREIVKQTAENVPQNAFKLDISSRTLDMAAKVIAKKIAVQLNDYYKLNFTKQNTKIELYREKALELKEKNQALAEENRKLKAQLVETNRNLNSYKPTIFGLFKFTGRKNNKKKR